MRGRDDLPTPEEWRKLKAEWTHDDGLRRMEERGVTYEDQAERPLDLAEKPAAGPRQPWPSEIAKANRLKQPEQENGKGGGHEHSHGHEGGHSM